MRCSGQLVREHSTQPVSPGRAPGAQTPAPRLPTAGASVPSAARGSTEVPAPPRLGVREFLTSNPGDSLGCTPRCAGTQIASPHLDGTQCPPAQVGNTLRIKGTPLPCPKRTCRAPLTSFRGLGSAPGQSAVGPDEHLPPRGPRGFRGAGLRGFRQVNGGTALLPRVVHVGLGPSEEELGGLLWGRGVTPPFPPRTASLSCGLRPARPRSCHPATRTTLCPGELGPTFPSCLGSAATSSRKALDSASPSGLLSCHSARFPHGGLTCLLSLSAFAPSSQLRSCAAPSPGWYTPLPRPWSCGPKTWQQRAPDKYSRILETSVGPGQTVPPSELRWCLST